MDPSPLSAGAERSERRNRRLPEGTAGTGCARSPRSPRGPPRGPSRRGRRASTSRSPPRRRHHERPAGGTHPVATVEEVHQPAVSVERDHRVEGGVHSPAGDPEEPAAQITPPHHGLTAKSAAPPCRRPRTRGVAPGAEPAEAPTSDRGDAEIADQQGDEQLAERGERKAEPVAHRGPRHPEHAVGQPEDHEGEEGGRDETVLQVRSDCRVVLSSRSLITESRGARFRESRRTPLEPAPVRVDAREQDRLTVTVVEKVEPEELVGGLRGRRRPARPAKKKPLSRPRRARQPVLGAMPPTRALRRRHVARC